MITPATANSSNAMTDIIQSRASMHAEIADSCCWFTKTKANRAKTSTRVRTSLKKTIFISNLVKSMNNFSKEAIQQQIKILITQTIVAAPTHKSVQLERTISEDAKTFLKMSCNYDENELTQLEIANGQLTD